MIEDSENFAGKNNKKILIIVFAIVAIILIVVAYLAVSFFVKENNDNNIKSNIYIAGIDVSGLSKNEAKTKLNEKFNISENEFINLKYKNDTYCISLTQINPKFGIDKAVDEAYNICRDGNIISNGINSYKRKKSLPINIEIDFTYNELSLINALKDISTKLPEQVIQSSYYIEGHSLIITSGQVGAAVEIDEMKEIIINGIMDCSFRNTSYNIVTYNEYPDPIDVDKIHSEVYQEVKDAYYTTNPRMVYAEVQGIDFEDSVEEVKNQIASEQKDEYEVPLKVTNPKVTTEDLGTEAFPNILGSFSTNYATSNRDRTTNLRLAAKKINGTVLMPGETFSYNKVVGERTIEAGYKEAAIYSNGEVTNGLGGGICQITSTLYNAVLYANLEIVQRQNHTFVPSYVKGGRDATVVYGSIDFKFKNDRDYPIKIYASVSGGVAKITIRGLKTENDYEVKLTSRKVDTNYYGGNSYSVYKAYKQLYKNGKLVDTELLSTDTYKNH